MRTPRARVSPSLLVLGAGRRLAAAALIVVALWAGFLWATSQPGGL